MNLKWCPLIPTSNNLWFCEEQLSLKQWQKSQDLVIVPQDLLRGVGVGYNTEFNTKDGLLLRAAHPLRPYHQNQMNSLPDPVLVYS